MEEVKIKGTVANNLWWTDIVNKDADFERLSTIKWAWYREELGKRNQAIRDVMKKLDVYREQQKPARDTRTIKPFPETTAQEIGWLGYRPEFKLEKYGSYYKKISLEPPENLNETDSKLSFSRH